MYFVFLLGTATVRYETMRRGCTTVSTSILQSGWYASSQLGAAATAKPETTKDDNVDKRDDDEEL